MAAVDSKNFVWADNLRVAATVAVIFLHVSSSVLFEKGGVIDLEWWTANIYNSSVRFCVPVFMMLTGALLLSKEYQLGNFLKSKFMRIILPFLFYSIIYIGYEIHNRVVAGGYLSASNVMTLGLTMLKDGSSFHFWYIYVIIGIYLFIPVLGKWIRHSTEKEVLFFLGVWLLVILFNQYYISSLNIKPNVDLTYFSGYIGYVVLGYYLSTKEYHSRQMSVVISAGLMILGIAMTAWGTFHLTSTTGQRSEIFFDNLTPNILIASIGTFLLIRQLSTKFTKAYTWVKVIGRYNYGIYLIHVLILYEMQKKGLTIQGFGVWLNVILNTIICLTLSLSVVYLINKIPFLGKKISG